MHRRTARLVTAAATAAAVVVPFAATAPAQASGGPVVKVLSSDFLAPLQFTVEGKDIYVADAGASTVRKVGQHTPLVTGPQPGEIGGVDVSNTGATLAYTSTDYQTGATALTQLTWGQAPVVSDLSPFGSGFEATHNPDGDRFYGVRHPGSCVRDALAGLGAPVNYTGILDSHPYSVTQIKAGNWAVADAAGNDILKVTPEGRVSLIAVMPRQPLTITAQMANNLGLPACVVGVTYYFEPVPTDVEQDRNGLLYVSTLPGGPEGPVLGARGSVYTVDPRSGAIHRLATGFAGATNVAVAPDGTVYVAELFGGQISKIVHGAPVPVLSLPGVVAVEFANGQLYASTLSLDENGEPNGPGTIVRIRL